jgi:NNP family nitrate/nitrite transporter-like MFS transporter
VFLAQAGPGGDREQAAAGARKRATAVIGIAGAVGALGGVGVNIAFRQSFLATGNGDAAYLVFIACYLACMALTWLVYLRAGRRLPGV